MEWMGEETGFVHKGFLCGRINVLWLMQSYADFVKAVEVGHVGWRLKEERKISLGVVEK